MEPTPCFPRTGAIYLDARGDDRALRLTWHDELGLVVLSLWRENVCAATFRLEIDEVPDLIDALRSGLTRAHDVAAARLAEADHAPDTAAG